MYFMTYCRAVKNRNLEIVHMLLERKAKLTATDKSGQFLTREITYFLL